VFIGETVTAEVEILEVHRTKPVCRVGMRIVKADGAVVLEGDAWCYTAERDR
jgi:acyl dehydratase